MTLLTGIHGEDDYDEYLPESPVQDNQHESDRDRADREREHSERLDREREEREREREEREREYREREERERESREPEDRDRNDQWPTNNVDQTPSNIFEQPIARIGGRIELNCNFGKVNRAIDWERYDRRPLPRGSYTHNNYLIIDNLHNEDAGKYVCSDRNNRREIAIYEVIISQRMLS